MSSEVLIQRTQTNVMIRDQSFSLWEILALKLFHPRAIFIDLVGIVWAFYFFWNHNWQVALVTFALGIVFSLLSAMYTDPQKLSETVLGRIGLLHLNPMNLVLRFIGSIFLLYGIWERLIEHSLIGMSLILLGHTYGWAKVDSRFISNDKV